VIVKGLAYVGCTLLALASSGCKEAERQAEAAPAPASIPAPPAPQPSSADIILSKTTLTDALSFSKSFMVDVPDEASEGTVLLGLWAREHLTWSDVKARRDETTIARTRKDPGKERGKRMCQSGKILQIASERADHGHEFRGVLMNALDEHISFVAVGSAKGIVPRSHAQFCGIVTGVLNYKNRGGGTTRSVQMVGMFDLAGNR
jgi:hypothetical protein